MRRTATRSLEFAALALALVAWTALPGAVEAQTGAIAGQVVDATNLQPIVGAQVFVPGSDLGTLTDEEGRYRVAGVPSGQVRVRVRLLGYSRATLQVEVRPGETSTLNFELEPSAVQLEEIVANVITGTDQQRRQIGTNSTVINAGQLDKAANNNFQSLLQGRSTGVVLQNPSGTTGGGTRIRIRGSNSLSLSNEPLVYVDGVRISSSSNNLDAGTTGGQEPSRLNDLNPEDIASIQVVKGPSATAQYGADAANGVILITTQSGQGGQTQWNFYAETGSLDDITEWRPNIMNFQLLDPNNETGVGGTNPSFFVRVPDGGLTPDGLFEQFNSQALAPCANWQAAEGMCTQDMELSFNNLQDPRTTPFSTGQRQRFGGNVSAGTETFSYYVSADWEEERGVHTNNSMEKFTTRANGNTRPRDDLDLNFNFSYLRSDLSFSSNDNSILSPLINGILGRPVFIPGDGGILTSGIWRGTDASFLNFGFNMTPQETQQLKLGNQQNDRITIGTNGDYRPLDFLSVRWNLGVDNNNLDEPATLQPGQANIAPSWTPGWRNRSFGQRTTWTFNGSVHGSYQLTEWLSATTTGGASFDQERLERSSCFGSSLVPGLDSCAATSQLFAVDEDFSDIRTVAGFGQQQFTVRDNLFLTASVRADDNSAAGGNADIELFPSGNASYVLSDEEFFPDFGNVLTEFRIRGAVGWSGVRPDFRDAATLFAPVTVTSAGQNQTGVTIASTGNPDLEVERVREFEAGFDAGFLNDRLSLQFTYYDKTSMDALVERELPPSFGLTDGVFENIAEVENTGIETALSGTALNQQNVGLDFQLQFTHNDNEITDLGDIPPITLGGIQEQREGFAAGSFFTRTIDFNDANGDGLLARDEVSVGERVFQDEVEPTWTTSLSTNLRLFDFVHVSQLWEARGGHSLEDFTENFRCRSSLPRNTGCPANGDRDASLDDQAALIATQFLGSDRGFIESARFLKLREVSVRFDAPPSLAEALPVFSGTSLTLAGRNLATFTDFSGEDPELNFGGATNFGGSAFNTLPPPRILTARLDFRF